MEIHYPHKRRNTMENKNTIEPEGFMMRLNVFRNITMAYHTFTV
jgi:hypothetical protein